jgi:transposase
MGKRYIILDADERATLEAGRHHHRQHQFRARCHGLLLRAEGHSVAALMQVLHVSRTTVCAWFARWETGGLAGLANAPGQGRPPVLTAADTAQGKAAVEANRQQLKEVTATLRQELNKDFSPKTLKRFLKSLGGRGDGFGMG